jgi:DNA ligase-1
MLLVHLVETSRRVSESSRRLEKVDVLAGLLKQARADESETAVAFLSGGMRQGRIGIGYASIREAAAPPSEVAALEILDVDRALASLADVMGRGAERQRREILHGLLSRATAEEQHFLTRLLLGELRQGALEGVMLDALAKASGVNLDHIRRAAMMAGSAQAIASAVLEKGEAGLEQYDIQLFRPVQPMLAQTAEDVSSALADLGESALEFKFDGARVQVHKSGDDVVAFSRRLNDVTAAVPEVVAAVRALPVKEIILDGEVLSLHPDGRPKPFQITMRRFGRKLDVDRMRVELPLSPFWFDLLYLDSASVIDEEQARRFRALTEIAPPDSLVPHTTTANAGHAEDFLHEALSRGHEGIMAKDPHAGYAAGARGQSWLKVKQARSLDLVILAAEWGSGRRQGWLSNLHLGARDTEKGGFAMLGKTFKGLTDEMLAWQTEQLLKLEIARDSYTVHVEPKLVAEIAFNEIQVSPRYASGLALRFARVKRYRPDKSVNDSDTFETVRKMAGL